MEREPGEQESSQSQHSDESRDSSCQGQTSILPSGISTPNPSPPCSGGPPLRQNNVSTVILHGVPIVSLVIDERERLCLAQISNTLLKDYSYNEIHNRRVALGITCVQCTPVQLEILRRAGAMPVSSRRCGMITKREAERLVKSFLEDNAPPKLPEDFAFSVFHDCGWGCRGYFEPSRYNSSRAKCIKCAFCSVYFSPNKFIFHYHRAPDAKYHHPDAANFNSWRRHLKLTPQTAGDDIVYAWEDVKAMFNGGSRKRILSTVTSSRSSGSSSTETSKKSKMDPDSTTLVKPSYSSQYPGYNMFSPPGKPYPFASVGGHHSFGINFSHGKDMHTDNSNKSLMPSGLWSAQSSLAFPGYDFFWANTLALSRGGGLRNNYYPALTAKPAAMADPHYMKMMPNNDVAAGNRKMPAPSSHMDNNANKATQDRFSAFRPVGRPSVTEEDKGQDKHSAINLSTTEEEENEEIDVTDDMEDDKTNFSSDDERYGRDEDEEEDESTLTGERGERRAEDVTAMQKGYNEAPARVEEERPATPLLSGDTEVAGVDLTVEKPVKDDSSNAVAEAVDNNNINEKGDATLGSDSDRPPETAPMDSGISETSDCEVESKDINGLSKEELYEQLKKEIETRRRIEREVNLMKETFQEQAKREKGYRDEMAQQLQVVRETLSSELDLERKSRFSLQQKLKEAHDALHNFSCKMLASRHCDECSYKDAPMPR